MEALRLQPLGRTTAVFSMVLGFILAKTLCPQRHSKVCIELLKTFGVTLQRPCPAGLVASPKSGSPCSNLTIVSTAPSLPYVPLNPFLYEHRKKTRGTNPQIEPEEADYKDMQGSFIYGDSLDFEELINRIKDLQDRFHSIELED